MTAVLADIVEGSEQAVIGANEENSLIENPASEVVPRLWSHADVSEALPSTVEYQTFFRLEYGGIRIEACG
jgi:hypothetical protein